MAFDIDECFLGDAPHLAFLQDGEPLALVTVKNQFEVASFGNTSSELFDGRWEVFFPADVSAEVVERVSHFADNVLEVAPQSGEGLSERLIEVLLADQTIDSG